MQTATRKTAMCYVRRTCLCQSPRQSRLSSNFIAAALCNLDNLCRLLTLCVFVLETDDATMQQDTVSSRPGHMEAVPGMAVRPGAAGHSPPEPPPGRHLVMPNTVIYHILYPWQACASCDMAYAHLPSQLFVRLREVLICKTGVRNCPYAGEWMLALLRNTSGCCTRHA
jgi:hypothetical protein